MSNRLLTKPLHDNLIGLQRKIDRLEDTRITQAISDCIQFVLIEAERLDVEEDTE